MTPKAPPLLFFKNSTKFSGNTVLTPLKPAEYSKPTNKYWPTGKIMMPFNTNENVSMENLYRDKLPGTGTSIFAVMSRSAKENGAVNLSQGFPDFDIDRELIDLVHYYMKKGFNQYAPMPGVENLRKGIARKIMRSYGIQLDYETEITVTAGATQALFTAITAFVFPGDEVILLEPAYDSYVPAIRLAGGKPVFIPLQKPRFRIDWDQIGRAVTERTKMIILNTPNNPGGYIFSENDWKQLEAIVRNKNILVLSDEVYEHIIFDGHHHESGLKYPALGKQLLAVFSFGKTFHATGWKTGYVAGNASLMKLFRKVHQFNVFSVNTPVQYALADYIENPEKYDKLGRFYQAKRDFFIKALQNSRWKIIPTSGTYFILLDYSDISNETEKTFALRLSREFKIAAIPLSAFYHDNRNQNLLRFCFAKKEETLRKAIEILQKI
jgi:methionine aminotransferase